MNYEVAFQQKMAELKTKNEGGLMLYLPLGDPTIEESLKLAGEYVKNGVDIIEIGIPTRNAFQDSEFIQDTMNRALDSETDLNKYFDALGHFKSIHSSVPLIALVYNHTILDMGINQFVKSAKWAGIEGIILIGEGNLAIENRLKDTGLFVVKYLPHHMPEKGITEAVNTEGFLYFQATPGSAGKHLEGGSLEACITYLKKRGVKAPIFCGIGVSTPEDVKHVISSGADAAIVGSAVLKKRSKKQRMINYIKQLKEATKN